MGIVEEELKKCQFANLSNYDHKTNTYHIPKYNKPHYSNGKCYLVTISKAIVKNPNSTLAVNWNNGHAPQMDCFKIYVSKALGKNIYVDGLGYDLETETDSDYMWSGWLNVDDITLIKNI